MKSRGDGVPRTHNHEHQQVEAKQGEAHPQNDGHAEALGLGERQFGRTPRHRFSVQSELEERLRVEHQRRGDPDEDHLEHGVADFGEVAFLDPVRLAEPAKATAAHLPSATQSLAGTTSYQSTHFIFSFQSYIQFIYDEFI